MGPMGLAAKIWRNYKNETVQVAGGGKVDMIMKVLKDHESLTETYKKRVKDMRSARRMQTSEIDAYEKQTFATVNRITQERLDGFREKATSKNKFIDFFNRISENLKDPTMKMTPEYVKIDDKVSKVFAGTTVPTGRYILGEGTGNQTIIDFGSLSR